jgi:hypothetical protein
VRPSDHPMVQGSTWPLMGVAGKGVRCVRLTTLPPSRAAVVKSGKLNFEELWQVAP